MSDITPPATPLAKPTAELSVNVTLKLGNALTYPRKGLIIEQVTSTLSKLNKNNSIFLYSSYNLIDLIKNKAKNRIQAQKALHLFSRIYQQQEKADYGAYKENGAKLCSEILNRDYGERYFPAVLQLLLDIGAINPPSGYWENRCRRYSYNKSFDFGAIECFRMMVSPAQHAKLSECTYWFQNPEANKSPFPEWLPISEQETYTKYKNYLLSVQRRLVLTPDWPELIETAPANRCQGIIESVCAFNDGAFYAKMGRSGRWFHYHTSCRRELRSKIKIDGVPTTEIDLKAAQPTIIASFYPAESDEKKKYLDMVLTGNFYERIAELVGMQFRPGTDDRDKFKERCLKEVFYDSAGDNIRPTYKVRQAFNAEFPELGKILNAKWKEAREELAMQMQKHEAKIVIDGVVAKAIESGIPVLPVHDSIFSRTKDAKQIEQWLMESFIAYTNIQPRIKVNNYS